MSRSYKKVPCVKDNQKAERKFANRKVRKFIGEIANGSAYKKLCDQYDICDWIVTYYYKAYVKDKEAEEKSLLNGGQKWSYCDNYSYKDWYKRYKRK